MNSKFSVCHPEVFSDIYEGWNFNSGNYLFTTDTKQLHVSKFFEVFPTPV